MHRMLLLAALAACGSAAAPPPSPANVATTHAPPASSDRDLVIKEFVDGETGAKHAVWIQAGREANVDTNDPCCGLSYDGNRYDDALASCAVKRDECAAGLTAVYPGLADDRVCGTRRRCVPRPQVRVIVHDATQVAGADVDDNPLAIGKDATVAHREVIVGREGFVDVTVASRTERVAVDYGSRYTIEVRDGTILRISRD